MESNPMTPSRWVLFLSSGAYFLYFLSIGFAHFPLQTHLRQLYSVSTASFIASVTPFASLLSFAFFRMVERKGWSGNPGKLLLLVSLGVMFFQALLGLQLSGLQLSGGQLGSSDGRASSGSSALASIFCLFLLGCANATCMTLVNHFAVDRLASHCYTARAAGSAGYMVAILLQGSLLADQFTLSKYHLFIASACAAINALFVALFYLGGIGKDASSAPPITKEVGVEANRQQSDSTKSNWVWYSLVALFWMIAFCESAYGLYSHEFLSRKYQSLGYYLFSGGILIEIVILLALPYLPKSTKQLLFTGPLGWFFVFSGCLLADQIAPAFGLCCLLMALNCPFQVACQETSHAIRPRMSGMASLGLAQAFGIVCAAWSSAVLNLGGQSPAGISEKQSALPWETLWQAALLVALSGLVLSLALNRTMSQSVRRSPDYQS